MSDVKISTYCKPIIPPCKDCSERTVGCHCTCEKYITWSNDRKAESAAGIEKYSAEKMQIDYSVTTHLKRKRGTGRWKRPGK